MFINRDINSIYSIYEAAKQSQQSSQDDEIQEGEVDKKTAEAFFIKLTRAKVYLFRKFPFFGILLQKLKTVPLTKKDEELLGIDTMAVDAFANIFISINFLLNELSDAEVVGVLAHEVMHNATLSFFRQRGRDMRLWNIATDYAMNRMLLEDGFVLPKLGCIPVQKNGRWYIVMGPLKIDITGMDAEKIYDALLPTAQQQAKLMQKLAELQQELDKHLTPSESRQIGQNGSPMPNADPSMQRNSAGDPAQDQGLGQEQGQGKESKSQGQEKQGQGPKGQSEGQGQKQGQQGQGRGQAQGQCQGGQCQSQGSQSQSQSRGSGTGGSRGNIGAGQTGGSRAGGGGAGKGMPEKGTTGEHKGQIKIPEPGQQGTSQTQRSEEAKAQSQAQSRLSQAITQSNEEDKRRGLSAGTNIPRFIDTKRLGARTNWKQILREFIISAAKEVPDYSREHRRRENPDYYVFGSRSVKNELNAIIALDTSGSISDLVASVFLGEIMSIIRSYRTHKLKLRVLLWTTEVYADVELDTKTMSNAVILNKLNSLHVDSGGTDISSVKRHLDKTDPGKPIKGGILYFTDGDVENNPRFPNAKRKLFLITEGGKDDILKKYGPCRFIDVPHA